MEALNGDDAKAAAAARFRAVMRRVRAVMALLTLVCVVLAGRSLFARWDASQLELSTLPVVLSSVPLIAAAVGLAIGWKWLLDRMTGLRLGLPQSVALHLESQLARYMPGKVGVPLIRMAGAERLGTTARTVGSSVLIETAVLIAAGGTSAFGLLAVAGGQAEGATALLGEWSRPLLVGFFAVTIVLLTVPRQVVPTRLLRLLALEGTGPFAPWQLLLVHIGYWLLWAVHG